MKVRPSSPTVSTELANHLKESGLNLQHLRALQVSDVQPDADPRISMPVRAVRLPYFDLDGNPATFDFNGEPTVFYRLRALEEFRDRDGKLVRYKQVAGSRNRLYLPPLLAVAWRVIAEDPKRTILITEGEKKAACGCVWGFATIGLGGVWNWKNKDGQLAQEFDLICWKGRRVVIVFDSDAADNSNSLAAAEQLADRLRELGADVGIVILPSHRGRKVGLDDFLVARGREGQRELADLTEKARGQIDHIELLNRSLAVVQVKGVGYLAREQWRDGHRELELALPRYMEPLYANRTIKVETPSGPKQMPVLPVWMRSTHRREFDRVVFKPGGAGKRELNYWQGWAVEAAEGDCQLLLDLIRNVLCAGNTEQGDYVIGWLAHMIQKPEELPGVAIVLRGGQGTGKTTFGEILRALLGQHYVHVASTDAFLGHFNGHLARALLVFGDEAFWAGEKRQIGPLKSLITDSERQIESKGVNQITIDNYTRLVLATNEDHPVPAELDDRRFLVLEASDRHKGDEAYFAPIYKQLHSGGASALLHYLQNYQLEGFSARSVPKTSALVKAKIRNLDPADRFIFGLLQRGANSGTKWELSIKTVLVQAAYRAFAEDIGTTKRADETILGMKLKERVPGLRTVRKMIDGEQVNHYVFPPLEECRAELAMKLGGPGYTWEMLSELLDGPAVQADGSEAGSSEESRPSKPSGPHKTVKTHERKDKVVSLIGRKGGQGQLPRKEKF